MTKVARPLWRAAYSRERAEEYAALLRAGLGPLYQVVLDAVCESLFLLSRKRHPRILDLGAGTGNLAGALLKRFPRASVVCLDGSGDMLAVARRRFSGDGRAAFVEKDFGRSSWSSGLGEFDAAVSTGAIHHLDEAGKARLFREVFGVLREGGVFLCADQVSGESERLGKVNEDAWVRVIKKNLLAQGKRHSVGFLRRQHRDIGEAEGDQPSRLSRQLEWLREAGFAEVDCFWKHFAFALFGGMRIHR